MMGGPGGRGAGVGRVAAAMIPYMKRVQVEIDCNMSFSSQFGNNRRFSQGLWQMPGRKIRVRSHEHSP